MGSLDRKVRMRQKAEAEAKIEARLNKLKEAGLDDKRLARDPLLRRVQAELKKVLARLRAIDRREALNQSLAQKKAQGKDQPKTQDSPKQKKAKEKSSSKKSK